MQLAAKGRAFVYFCDVKRQAVLGCKENELLQAAVLFLVIGVSAEFSFW